MQKMSEGIEAKTLGKPDEVRTFDKGKVEIFNVGGAVIGRATFNPGWKWSECVKPVAKTESCQAAHVGYQLSGTMHIVFDDGRELDINKGDFFSLPAGHDGWVVGEEPAVALDFQGMGDYAKKSEPGYANAKEGSKGRKH